MDTIQDGTTEYKVITPVEIYRKRIESIAFDVFKSKVLALFPVGTILETINPVNPSEYVGGTWEQLPAGTITTSAGTTKYYTNQSIQLGANKSNMRYYAETSCIPKGGVSNSGHLPLYGVYKFLRVKNGTTIINPVPPEKVLPVTAGSIVLHSDGKNTVQFTIPKNVRVIKTFQPKDGKLVGGVFMDTTKYVKVTPARIYYIFPYNGYLMFSPTKDLPAGNPYLLSIGTAADSNITISWNDDINLETDQGNVNNNFVYPDSVLDD